MCDFSDAYFVVNWTITAEDPNDANYDKELALKKKNAPFTSCISKINNTLIDNVDDLEILMPLYNLIDDWLYNTNYLKRTESLWNYYIEEPNSGVCDKNNKVNYSIKDSGIFRLQNKKYMKIRRY